MTGEHNAGAGRPPPESVDSGPPPIPPGSSPPQGQPDPAVVDQAAADAPDPPKPPAKPEKPWEYFAAFLGLTTPLLQLLGVFSGGTEPLRRNEPYWFWLSVFLSLISLTSVAWVWIRRPRRRERSAATLIALVSGLLALAILLFLWGSGAATNFRPVILATVSGTGPITIEGKVTSAGVSADGLLAMRIFDGKEVIYDAAMGPQPTSGAAEIAYKVQIERGPDREIAIVAWVTEGSEPSRVSCDEVATDLDASLASSPVLFSCLKVRVQPPVVGEPWVSISADAKPGERAVTVTTSAVVTPGKTVLLTIWDGTAILYSSLIRPAPDGAVSSAVKVPLSDGAASICATAVTLDARTFPSPRGPTCSGNEADEGYAALVIPAAPSPSPSTSPPRSAAPSASPS